MPSPKGRSGSANRPPSTAARVLEPLVHPGTANDTSFRGPVLPIAFPSRVDVEPAEILGASTEAVLREVAGCTDADLARLRAAGVIP